MYFYKRKFKYETLKDQTVFTIRITIVIKP